MKYSIYSPIGSDIEVTHSSGLYNRLETREYTFQSFVFVAVYKDTLVLISGYPE